MKIKKIMTGQKKRQFESEFMLLEAEDNLTNTIFTHRGGNQVF